MREFAALWGSWASLRSSVVLRGRNNTFCGPFLFFWCKSDRVTTSRQEMKARYMGNGSHGKRKGRRMALKYRSFPIWSFSHMYFNFASWKHSLNEKVLGPCDTCLPQTIFWNITPSLFSDFLGSTCYKYHTPERKHWTVCYTDHIRASCLRT